MRSDVSDGWVFTFLIINSVFQNFRGFRKEPIRIVRPVSALFPWEEFLHNRCIYSYCCCLFESLLEFLEQSPVAQERSKQVTGRLSQFPVPSPLG